MMQLYGIIITYITTRVRDWDSPLFMVSRQNLYELEPIALYVQINPYNLFSGTGLRSCDFLGTFVYK